MAGAAGASCQTSLTAGLGARQTARAATRKSLFKHFWPCGALPLTPRGGGGGGGGAGHKPQAGTTLAAMRKKTQEDTVGSAQGGIPPGQAGSWEGAGSHRGTVRGRGLPRRSAGVCPPRTTAAALATDGDTGVAATGDRGPAPQGSPAQPTASGTQGASGLAPAPLPGATGWPACWAVLCHGASSARAGPEAFTQRRAAWKEPLRGAGAGSCLPLGAPCSQLRRVPRTKRWPWAQGAPGTQGCREAVGAGMAAPCQAPSTGTAAPRTWHR